MIAVIVKAIVVAHAKRASRHRRRHARADAHGAEKTGGNTP